MKNLILGCFLGTAMGFAAVTLLWLDDVKHQQSVLMNRAAERPAPPPTTIPTPPTVVKIESKIEIVNLMLPNIDIILPEPERVPIPKPRPNMTKKKSATVPKMEKCVFDAHAPDGSCSIF